MLNGKTIDDSEIHSLNINTLLSLSLAVVFVKTMIEEHLEYQRTGTQYKYLTFPKAGCVSCLSPAKGNEFRISETALRLCVPVMHGVKCVNL